MSPRALREDIENQPRPIEHTTLERTLEVAFLGRRQGMVENDEFGTVGLECGLDLLELATADERTRVGAAPTTLNQGNRLRPGRAHQLQEFTRIFALMLVLKVHMDQNRRFAGVGTFEKQSLPLD